ncbi:transposase [Bacillaceae bacterium Marseille-Q3522]|nr:transposase [Bacillaceae bacterium Marseille-Q3522]
MKRKSYSKDFKAKVVLEILREEKTLNEISSKYSVHVNQLQKWKKIALKQLSQLFDRWQKDESRMQANTKKPNGSMGKLAD